MIRVPEELLRKFDALLSSQRVPWGEWGGYRKWLRFYLDFCHKYKHGYADAASLAPFLEKLKSRRQGPGRREQAAAAGALYLRMVRDADAERRRGRLRRRAGSGVQKALLGSLAPPGQAQWRPRLARFEALRNSLTLKHYSVRTTLIYTHTVPSRTKKERKSPLDFL